MKKIDLNEVVKFYENEPRAGTYLIAYGFGRKHKKVLELIRKYQKNFESFGPLKGHKVSPKVIKFVDLKSTNVKHKRGRPPEEYLLSEPQAAFLGTLFRNNDQVIDFKERLVKKFFIMKDALAKIRLQKHDPEHIRARIEGKIPRRLETTILSELVPYSVNQGSEGYSKNPENCYINYTTMTNNALFIVAKGFKNIRNYLDKKQLRRVAVAEDVIADLVTIKMAEGLHYKEIYQEIKKKIEAYGAIIGKTKVPKIEYQKQLALF